MASTGEGSEVLKICIDSRAFGGIVSSREIMNVKAGNEG